MQRIPRAGWLAIGALVAALLLRDAGPLAAVAGTIGLSAAFVLAVAHRRSAAALALAFGTVALRASLVALLAGPGSVVPALVTGSAEWDGTVTDVSAPKGPDQRAFITLEPPGRPEGWLVYAWLPRHPALVTGDRVHVRGVVEGPPASAPGFADFLESRGAVGTLKAHALELRGHGSGLGPTVEQLRWAVDGALGRAVPEPEAGLASGILIGLRERVSQAVADDFTVTGLTHVVAISGWNIALVAGIATALLRATGLRRRWRSAIVLAAIVAYTVFAGADASVVRAAVMGGVVLIAREGGRPSGAAAALGLACWGLLLADPGMIEDIGLQLSMAATAGLLALGGPAERAVRRACRDRGPRWLSESLGVSLAAQLSTLPLVLFHFGRLSLISPLANLLVAPVVPLAMLGAVIGVVVAPLLALGQLSLLLAPLLLAAWLPLVLMTRGASLLARVPLANVELAEPLDIVGALVALAILVVVLRRTRRSRRRPELTTLAPTPTGPAPPTAHRGQWRLVAAGLSLTLVATVSVALVAGPAAALRVSVLDVGQGDAVLLEARDGERMLVDGGPDPDVLVRRLDERIPTWDRRIDTALLTHPHEDHAGGLAGLAPRYRVGRVVETGMPSEGAGVLELRAASARLSIPRSRVLRGDRLRLGQAAIEVVWPPRELLPDRPLSDGRAINGTSIVLAVHVGEQHILLTGDAEDDHDADLLEALAGRRYRWDLLKVAHHGSATSTSQPLLEALRPRLAVISSGTGNPYGHPAPATLARLASVGASVWRTDRGGTLTVDFDGRTRSAGTLLAAVGSRACVHRPAGARSATSLSDPCYIRPDGGTNAHRGALPAPVHVALAALAAAHDGGRRGGGLPGLSQRARRGSGGPAPGGNGRAPPRRRQGAARRPPAESPAARRRRRRLGDRGRAPGAGPHSHRPSGHALHRSRYRALAAGRSAGGAHRDLCRQASHATGGLSGPALRALGAQASGVRGEARAGADRGAPVGGCRLRGGGDRAV